MRWRSIIHSILTGGALFVGGVLVQGHIVPKLAIGKRIDSLMHSERPVNRSPMDADYWTHRTSHFKSIETIAPVVMVGDSLTDGAEWNELFPSVQVANRGIGGDTAGALLNRLDDVLRGNPRKVFVMVGINDVALEATAEVISKDICESLQKITAIGARPFFQCIIHPGEARKEFNHATIDRINRTVEEYCKGHGVTVIDLNPLLAPKGFLLSEFSADGLHLNGSAYQKWASIIRSEVEADALAH